MNAVHMYVQTHLFFIWKYMYICVHGYIIFANAAYSKTPTSITATPYMQCQHCRHSSNEHNGMGVESGSCNKKLIPTDKSCCVYVGHLKYTTE